jgi:hypothetical protein
VDVATEALKRECERQEESCLYTSTALFEWLKDLRLWRTAFITLPIVCAAVATSALLKHWPWVTGIATILAGVSPAIFKALDLDRDLRYAWLRDFRPGRLRRIGRSGDWRRRTGRHRGAERRQAFDERLLKLDAHLFGLGPLSGLGALAKVISVDLAADPLGAVAAAAGTVS